MCRKVVYMACVAAMLSMAMQVLAANDWTNTTGDGKWSTAANWSEGIVPTITPDSIGDPRINLTGANACTIDGTMPQAVAQWLHIGNFWGETGTLNVVAGGKIGTPIWGTGETFVGGENTSATGILNIDGAGSVAKSEGWRIGSATLGSAVVNITNGGVMQGGTWDNYIRATATVNIMSGGVMQMMGVSQFVVDGVIDISGPTSLLLLETDRLPLVNALIAAGKITGNGIVGNVSATYNEIVPGYTVVTAIPEPMTLAILGLGGLLLRRRNV